ncbi:MAG: hypothetical protein RPV21_14615 [Candidatus Sedimenticola sp. (ex Thyasira tokunagai)]
MKYTANKAANRQISLIAKYIKQGLSDSEILVHFDGRERNLKSGNHDWSEIEIKEIREGFDLDNYTTILKIIEKMYAGLILSIPSSLLIYLGLSYKSGGTGSAILLGIVFLLGVPWNVIALIIFYALLYVFIYIDSYLELLFNIDLNHWEIIIWMLILSGIIGTHVNGIAFAKKVYDD